MKRIMIFILAFAATVNYAAAQSFTVTRDKLSPTLIDTRLPIQSFGQSYPSTPARAMTRGSVSATDDLKWIDRIHNLPASMRGFYDRYSAMIDEAKSGTDNALVKIQDGDTLHISEYRGQKTFTLQEGEDFNSREVVIGHADQAIMDIVDSLSTELIIFSPYLFASIRNDNDIFWFSNFYYTAQSVAYDVKRNGLSNVFTVYYTIYSVQLLCDSEDNFDNRLEEFRDYASLKAAFTEYKSLIQSIIADAPTTNRYEKVRYLNNWLTRNNAYSTDFKDSNQPCWSSISALRGSNGPDGPVCEGYSRAMKVLCDALGVPCRIASGLAIYDVQDTPDNHAWNEIQMDNGKWYAVDVTWNDPVDKNNPLVKNSGLEIEDWLLLGKNDIVVPGLTFAQSHIDQPVAAHNMIYSQYWDYSYESPIEDYRYDHISSAQAPVQAETINAYSIIGVNLGSFRSIDEAVSSLEPGIYIIGGRKVAVY